jgi:C_GCAxxG_C_C family probable redox protein
MDNQASIQKAYNLGFEYEANYGNCAQCTVAAVQDALGMKDDIVFKAASGFGGGIGRNCDGVCGGYSGGVMMLSSYLGRPREIIENKDCMIAGYNSATTLHDLFISKFGTVICKDIHTCLFGRNFNLRDQADMDQFNAMGAHVDKCTVVVGQAAAWTAEILLREMESKSTAG